MMDDQLNEIKILYEDKSKRLGRQITGSRDAFEVILPYYERNGGLDYDESFWVIYMSRSNRVKGVKNIATGGMSGVLVDLKKIFGTCLKSASSGMILVHNHPSGNPNPSGPDLSITQKIENAAKLFDIDVLDHLIIADKFTYYSMADEGQISNKK